MRRRIVGRRVRLTAGAGLLSLVLVACGTVIDDERLEQNIRGEVQGQAGITLAEVECPEDRPAQAGDVFTCTATGEDGRTLVITVTQDDDQGNVRWEVTEENLPSPSP